jgi:hypothetical protein
MGKAAVCHLCRDEVVKPWIIDGWKPVCKPCFDSFRSIPGVEVIKAPKRGGPPDTQKKAGQPVSAPVVVKLPSPEPTSKSHMDVLGPDDEPYVILYPEDLTKLTDVLPEDCMVLPGQPEAWRAQWDQSKLKRMLDTEKEWFPEADEPDPQA